MPADTIILAETLIAVLETGSFSAAAGRLGVSQSTVSRRISSLEAELGGRPLFLRGTRWVEPTPRTALYVREVRELLCRLDQINAIAKRVEGPFGQLRISLPPALGRARLVEPLARLASEHHDMKLMIDLSSDYVDLRDGDYDVAVRIRPAKEKGIAQVLLGRSALTFCAHPAYIADRGSPRTYSDLEHHRVIGLVNKARPAEIFGSSSSRPREPSWTTLEVSDVGVIHQLVTSGYGISMLPDYLIRDDLAEGRLTALPELSSGPGLSIYGLCLYGRRHEAGVSMVFDELRSVLA